jgi:hypothetical protein
MRRFLIEDAAAASLACPACEVELELMVRSIPGPPGRAASALGAKLLREGRSDLRASR